MEYIDGLFTLVKDYWFLILIIAIFTTFLETFIPALPLMAIVIANSMMLGLGVGLIASTLGSGIGTIILFLLAKKFRNLKIFKNIKSYKLDKAISWVKEQGFITLFIAYACPFIPGFLVTVASGISGRDLYNFVPAMISGRFVMMMFASYIGNDLIDFIKSPIKIILFTLLVIISFFVGRKINSKIETKHNEKKL